MHEAALVDYASMWLRKVDGQKLRAMLAPSSHGPAVVRHGAFTTPWRTMQPPTASISSTVASTQFLPTRSDDFAIYLLNSFIKQIRK